MWRPVPPRPRHVKGAEVGVEAAERRSDVGLAARLLTKAWRRL